MEYEKLKYFFQLFQTGKINRTTLIYNINKWQNEGSLL